MIERDEIVDRLRRFYQEVGTPPPVPSWNPPARPRWSRLTPAFAALALLTVGAVVAINLHNARRAVTPPPVRSSPAPIPKAQVSAAHFFDPAHGWGLTADGLFSTADGGATWTNISPSALAKPGIAYFLDSRHGWVSSWELRGTGGNFESVFLIFKTDDGGRTWQQHDLHLPGYQAGGGSLSFVDQTHGWLVAVNTTSSNFSDGLLFRTDDGGVTWHELTIPNGFPVRFLSASTGWNVGAEQPGRPGYDTLYLTRDGGATWRAQPITLPSGLNNPFFALPTFIDDRHGVLPVTFPAQRTEAFYISNDGGLSWQLKATEQANVLGGEKITLPSAPMPVAVTGQTSWVVAWATHLNVETNGNNVAIDPQGFVQVDELSFVSSRVGWAVTTASGSCSGFKTGCVSYRYVLRTLDGGHTWAPIDIP
jgi:photosystem II stability/assembly factor-like uncharacterized protein